MTPPLQDIRVIEFGHYIAAPAATQILRDLGAEVIKVESAGGDQARSIGAYGEGIVSAYNRGKHSVVLDLKTESGREAALDLVRGADVVVQNLRAGVMERLGLGADLLLAAHPRLVHASITGFGVHGPSADRAGLDIAAQAESGIMSITGEADGPPQRVGFPVADVAASYAVVQAVLAALFRRERTGAGGRAEVSLLNSAVHAQSAMWGEWHHLDRAPRRKGNGQATVAPAADLVDTADGVIVLSAYTGEHFARLCHLIDKPWMIDDPRFADNPARVQHRAELIGEITAVLGALTTVACVDLLTRHGLVAAAVRDYAEVMRSADVVANGTLTTGLDVEDRQFAIPTLPFRLDGVDVPADLRVPAVGADTDRLIRGAP